MTQGQLKCVHCDKWVDKIMCHVSHICPYCGGRMDTPPVATPAHVPDYDLDDDDEEEGDGLSIVGAVVGAAILETVFDDNSDPYSNDEDPCVLGGGSFGGGGADDSW